MTTEEYWDMQITRNELREEFEKAPYLKSRAIRKQILELDKQLSEYENANNPSTRTED